MRTATWHAGALALLAILAAARVRAEDGHELWLRYPVVSDAALLEQYRSTVGALLVPGDSATARIVRDELQRGLGGLLGRPVPVVADLGNGMLVAGTPANSPIVAGLKLESDLRNAGPEGYLIRSVRIGGRRATVVAANADAGVLHGAYHFLRLLQTHQRIDGLAIAEAPRIRHRVRDHWDNLDGSVERGYAGCRCENHKLPDYRSPRYTDYARANASLGINGPGN